ncbi:VirB3 family type IV secretion system protein [Burkholderia cenocepacia]|uniref:VirB3 family type IV secretion system protein n=1 Tax=Burkholderia cenocepacia TaxID=95486 RepID=UPI002230D2D4|nr:VirB3 family type IV secretion system protein [Burkholderia cenocepacia]MCW3677845.1 VirB3 family type IV secretion system protein [Burkholderia cenocepacia]
MNADVDEIDPTVVDINKNRLEKFFLFWIDRKWCIGEFALFGIFALIARTPWIFALLPFSHFFLWWSVRNDPDQFRAYLRYRKQGDRYEPRQVVAPGENGRPVGFGRFTQC